MKSSSPPRTPESRRKRPVGMVEFDNVLKEIGECGRAQIIQYLLLCLCVFNAGLLSVDVVFFAAKPQHHCDIPSNVTNPYKLAFPNATTTDLLPIFIPTGSSCKKFEYDTDPLSLNPTGNLTEFVSSLANVSRVETECKSRTFIHDVYGNTVVSEYDVVCERKWLRMTMKMLYFGGRFVGAVVLGQLSDRFGRLPIFLSTVVINIITGIGLYFSKNIPLLGIFFFFHGVVQVGYTLTCFVLATELVGPKYRRWFGTALQAGYAFAIVLIPGFSILLPNWRHLALLTSMPSILYLSYALIVDESPRWLVARGRYKDALKILKAFAKRNGKAISPETEELFLNQKVEKSARLYTVVDLLRTWKRAALTLNIWFNWVTNSLVYYGIIYNLDNMGPNPHLNLAILGLIEFPGYAMIITLLDRVGRRPLLIGSLLTAAVFCLICAFLPTEPSYLITIFAMLGKFGITASYGVIYFFTAELFPTCVRNLAVGMGSTWARVGGVLSSPILSLQDTGHRFLPMLVFGVMSLIAGGLSILIPETKGINLPSTFDDEKFFAEEKKDEDDEKADSTLIQENCAKNGDANSGLIQREDREENV